MVALSDLAIDFVSLRDHIASEKLHNRETSLILVNPPRFRSRPYLTLSTTPQAPTTATRNRMPPHRSVSSRVPQHDRTKLLLSQIL